MPPKKSKSDKKDPNARPPWQLCLCVSVGIIGLLTLVAIALSITALVKISDVGTQCQQGVMNVSSTVQQMGSAMKGFQSLLQQLPPPTK